MNNSIGRDHPKRMVKENKISVINHPDYQSEVERLEFTKIYIDTILESSKGNKEGFKENIKQAFVDLDYLDSSLSYINILTNARFFEMTSNELEKLESIKNSPYFARINFSKSKGEQEEILYIGKTSLYNRDNQMPIIVDWRSPVANVYYDGRIGEVSYEVNEEERKGFLALKRQYKIEQGALREIRDIDLTTHDELLQESLSGKADNRLTEIVSTIQKEQNEVIRAPLKKPIVVQGAAGSGKTTIALHRISYFLYTFSETFLPEKLMILAPNRLYNEYISAVLPDLGVDRIKQTTFIDFILESLGKKVKIASQEDKLLSLMNDEDDSEVVRIASEFKGSFEMKTLLDHYIKEIEQTLVPTEDFVVEKFRLKKGKKIEHLFLKEYNYLPVYQRLDKIRKLLSSDLKTKKKQILSKLEDKYDDALERALYGIKNESKRKKKVSALIDRKVDRLQLVQEETKVAVRNYFKSIHKRDLFSLYKELMTSQEKLFKYSSLDEESANRIATYCSTLFSKNRYEIEDLAPLYYLRAKLIGIDPDLKMKAVFIDEAQDYSYFQFVALKEGLETNLFTIVGDLAQGIHAYRGLNSWTPLVERIFPESNYHSLQRSYRTTIEIMELANEILSLMPEELPSVNPVVRHGDKPQFTHIDPMNKNKLKEVLVKDITELELKEYHSIAIIGKTNGECQYIYRLLEKSGLEVQLLKDTDDMKKGHFVIVPSYLSKGLEFDVVLLVSIDKPYTRKELDIKLLYVSMTRPMHQLRMYGHEPSDFLLDKVISTSFNIVK